MITRTLPFRGSRPVSYEAASRAAARASLWFHRAMFLRTKQSFWTRLMQYLMPMFSMQVGSYSRFQKEVALSRNCIMDSLY